MFEDLQKIIIYINADSTVGLIVDQYGQSTSAVPVVIRSGEVLLCLRLLQDAEPYPADKLNLISNFDCIFDNDWDMETAPKLRADNENITVVSSDSYTEVQIPLLATNTTELAAAIANQQSITLGMELCGFVVDKTAPVFVLQVEGVKIQNRRGNAGMAYPTPVDPNLYTISQVNDLLDSKSDIDHDHHSVYQREDISTAYQRAASVLASMMIFVRNGAVNAYLTLNDIKVWLATYFSAIDHNHDGTYAVPGDIPADLSELSDETGILDGKSNTDHNHDGDYATPDDIPSDLSELSDDSGILGSLVYPKRLDIIIPTDPDDTDVLRLEIELASEMAFETIVESIDTGASAVGLEVYDGDIWVAFPASGIPMPYFGGIVSVPLQNVVTGTKYYGRYRWHDGTAYYDYKGFIYPSGGVI